MQAKVVQIYRRLGSPLATALACQVALVALLLSVLLGAPFHVGGVRALFIVAAFGSAQMLHRFLNQASSDADERYRAWWLAMAPPLAVFALSWFGPATQATVIAVGLAIVAGTCAVARLVRFHLTSGHA